MKTLIQKDICTPMFIAALFIVTKTGKQLEYLLMGEWIKKLLYTHTHVQWIYLGTKNKHILSFAARWVDLDGTVPSKISQRKRKTNTVWSHLYVEPGGGRKDS